MASTRATGFEVITTGADGVAPGGWINSGWVLVMFIVGPEGLVGRGKMLIRAVSFFGPGFTDDPPFCSRTGRTGRIPAGSSPGGFGSGCKSDDEAGALDGVTRGRRGEKAGASAVDPDEEAGAILGGNRRIGVTGVREGRTIRAVSRLAMFGAAAACSGRGGSAMRTVSFFGSAMSNQRASTKSHKSVGAVTCYFVFERRLKAGVALRL